MFTFLNKEDKICGFKKKGPIGSAVLTFIGYKQTNKQTDNPNLDIYRSLDSTYIILPSFYHTVILCLSIHYAINRDGRVPFHFVCSLFVNDPFRLCFFNGNKNYLTFSINFILFLIERLFSKFSRSVKSFFYPFPAGGGGGQFDAPAVFFK